MVRVCWTGCCIGVGANVRVAAYWFHSLITSGDIATGSAITDGSPKADAFAAGGPQTPKHARPPNSDKHPNASAPAISLVIDLVLIFFILLVTCFSVCQPARVWAVHVTG